MLMDFIFGKKEESNLNQRSQALNDLLLDELMKQYQQGPNPLPTYTAMAPDLAYSAPNTLLASLGLEQAARPDLPTTEIGGRTVYSSEALQKAMEEKFAAENPELYARLKREMEQRMNPAPVASPVAQSSSDNDDDVDPFERHYQLFPHTRPTSGPYASNPNRVVTLSTGQSSSTPRPILREEDRSGLSGLEQTVRQKVGGLMGRVLGRG